MPRRLFSLYQRKRIVNINANIIAAGLLALIPTTGVVWAAKLWVPEAGGLSIPEWLWTSEQTGPQAPEWLWISSSVAFTAIGLTSDVIFDVAIYYLLHWVANHWRPVKGRTEKEQRELGSAPPPFMRDATLIQFERALLSPLYYITAGGLMQWLQVAHHMRPGFAVLIAFPVGLLLTRIIHTMWGLRSGRFRDNSARHAAGEGGAQGPRPDDGDQRAA